MDRHRQAPSDGHGGRVVAHAAQRVDASGLAGEVELTSGELAGVLGEQVERGGKVVRR